MRGMREEAKKSDQDSGYGTGSWRRHGGGNEGGSGEEL